MSLGVFHDILSEYFQKEGIKFIPSSVGENFIMCQCMNPQHNDKNPSMSINTDNGDGYCFTCGYEVTLTDFIGECHELSNGAIEALELKATKNRIESLNEDYEEDYQEPIKFTLPKVFRKFNNTSYRGISPEILTKTGVYLSANEYHENKDFRYRVMFPYYQQGKLVGYEGRVLDNRKPKYLRAAGVDTKQVIYPYALIAEKFVPTLFVVEGVMDCLSLWELGYPAICNFGTEYNYGVNKLDMLSEMVGSLVVAFDNDEAGQRKGKILEKKLGNNMLVKNINTTYIGRQFVKSGVNDWNDFLNSQ